MKCEHCGKNEATFYYKSNINGEVTEQHLCSECAKELGYADSLERSAERFGNFERSLFGGFDQFFSPVPALAGGMFEPFERAFSDFGRAFPMLNGSVAAPVQSSAEAPITPQKTQASDLVNEQQQKELDHERRLNALRAELQSAIQTENFERAAVLRDEIHGLDVI